MRAVLRPAGAVEQGSEHPLGRTIVAYAMGVPPRDRVRASGDVLIGQGTLPEVSGFAVTAGRGVRGRAEGRLVEVLAPDGELPAALTDALRAAEAGVNTPVLVRVDGVAEALIEVGDVVRPGSYRAVDRLRRLGVRPVLATGDREAPAQAVAVALGIEEVYARCTPEDSEDFRASLAPLIGEGPAADVAGGYQAMQALPDRSIAPERSAQKLLGITPRTAIQWLADIGVA